ncbi:ankyrin repeat-containing domain protein, partial [Peziza echinospora]
DRCNIDGEADRNRVAVPVFAWAAAAGHREVVELLFDERSVHGYGGAGVGQPPLVIAAARGHVGVVRLLLDCGFRELGTLAVGASQALAAAMWQAQTVAATRGHLGVFKILLTHPSIELLNEESVGISAALWDAASAGHAEVVRVLLDHRTDQKSESDKVLGVLHACKNGHPQVVSVLLAYPSLHWWDDDSFQSQSKVWTPIRVAMYNGHREIIKLLME